MRWATFRAADSEDRVGVVMGEQVQALEPGLRMLDLLAANPYVTVKGAAEKMKVAFTTAQRAVDRLQKAGVLSQVSEAKRGRVYCARPILEILEEPARLMPIASA